MNSETYSSLNETGNTRKQIEFAINHCFKLGLQTSRTPDYEFIIFHPYAFLTDLFDGLSVIGLVERHYEGVATNYLARLKLHSITFVEILPIDFEPNVTLWKTVELELCS